MTRDPLLFWAMLPLALAAGCHTRLIHEDRQPKLPSAVGEPMILTGSVAYAGRPKSGSETLTPPAAPTRSTKSSLRNLASTWSLRGSIEEVDAGAELTWLMAVPPLRGSLGIDEDK
jgi:hypothetical protein